MDAERQEVRFRREGVMLDLGSIAKGYALDKAAEILADAGISHALLHGGTSTVIAIGENADEGKWKIAIDPLPSSSEEPTKPLAVLDLVNESLSVSAISGKYFEHGGRKLGHVLDPRTGHPVSGHLLAAVILESALETDALSTALLVGGGTMFETIRRCRPAASLLLLMENSEKRFEIMTHGIPLVG
jgi:FAD:protein FMN transferase